MKPTNNSPATRSTQLIEAIFRPATLVMNRLAYFRKFVLIGVLILTPLAFLLRLQYTGTGDSIEFNAGERIGIAYIQPLKSFLAELQRRRVLAAALGAGVVKYESDFKAATAEVEARLSDVDEADKLYGAALKTTAKWTAIKQGWTKLEGTPRTDAGLDDAHGALTSAVVDLILNYAGNNSNLILDPDLDSYWLMDAFVIKIPMLGEGIADSAARLLKTGVAPVADQVLELAGTRRVLLATASDLVNVNMKTAVIETKNPKFGQSPTLEVNLKEPLQTARVRVDGFAETLKQRLVSSSPDDDPRQVAEGVVAQALVALDAVRKLYEKTGPELDWLCAKRVGGYLAVQRQGLMLGGLATLLLVYVFTGLYLSVRNSAVALAGSAERMIAGTDEIFELESKDELGDVAGSFNQINEALLEARRLRQQVENDNQSLQENIMDLLGVVSDAADGDLTVRAKITTGGLGNVSDAFNHLLESLQTLIGAIDAQLKRTNAAVAKISLSSREMVTGATNQAGEVLAATKLVEGMGRDIQRVSQNARVAAEAAKRAQESAHSGTQGVNNVIVGMGTLRANVQAGAKKMKNLGDRSMEITGIVGTINRISEQTNMLALNAAIEAVRAGEHGRGFSIVAEQVRKLAERTAVATEEIEKLVKAIHNETTDTVEAIEQQTQFVERESELVGKAGESLAHISLVSTESANLVAQINDVTMKQVEGVTIIAKTMDGISSIARSTQLGAEGTVTTMQELTELSEQLIVNIRRFKLGQAGQERNGVNGAAA